MKKAIFFLFVAIPAIFFLFLMGQKSLKKASDDEELMGGKKCIQKHVITKEDRSNLALYLSTQKPKDPSFHSSIPKTFHFIWLKPSGLPKETKKFIQTFLHKHPGWTCKIWTDSLSQAPFPYCELASILELKWTALRSQYLLATSENVKSLLLRLEILHREGGIFIDHNLTCVQSLEPLRERYDFFMGLQPLQEPTTGSAVALCDQVIGASAFHPIIQAQIEGIKENWPEAYKTFLGTSPQSEEYRKFYAITLPMEQAVKTLVNQGRNTILPTGYFRETGGHFGLFTKVNERQLQLSHLGKFETLVMQNLIKMEKRSGQLLLGSGLLALLCCFFFVYSLVRWKHHAH